VSDVRSGDRDSRRIVIACVFAVAAFVFTGQARPAYAAPTIHSIISGCTTAAGFGTLDVAAMKSIADYESHDNPKCHSSKCWGLFQLSTSLVRNHPWADATWNTKRALRYVKSRYGTPRKAWTHIRKTGWY
jgi:hypothetical protein